LLDGHFVVEHTARHASGRWFNFNGTAGIWRREAITDGGGWQHDTLTEDLDLSYRAQLAGWRFVYLVDVVAPAELPRSMAAFKQQQHRWAKGSIQTGRKLLGRIWGARAPLSVKAEATAHLTANVSYPLVVIISLLLPAAIMARIEAGTTSLLAIDLGLFSAALAPFILYYLIAVLGSGSSRQGWRVLALPLALALGLGMALAQTRALIEGLFGEVGVFARTPKSGGTDRSVYRTAVPSVRLLEAAMATYLALSLGVVLYLQAFTAVPFLCLFTVGYGLVAFSRVGR
jgi:cellulose synthase/poly-beta-1,6-N-acetylglucosamine synthase-like glycosyltransferase